MHYISLPSRATFLRILVPTIALALLLLFLTPLRAEAIMFLLILPATFGGFIGTLILEIALWCIAGVICGGGGGGGGNGPVGEDPSCEEPPPSLNFTAEYTDPSNAWGDNPLQEGEINIVAPGDEIRLTWNSDGDECAIQLNTDEPDGTTTSGEFTFIPGEEFGVGRTGTYSLLCQEQTSGCDQSTNESYFFQIPEPNLDEDGMFVITPDIVRQGGQAELSWDIRADGRTPPYSMNCAIYGAVPDTNLTSGIDPTVPDARFSFDSAELPSWTVPTIPLMNKFVNALICLEPITGYNASTTNEVEVVPAQQER